MDALKDIWASLVNGVRERTTNPLSFAFLLSWAAWNFKFFVILFGDGTSSARLAALDQLYPNITGTYLSALLYPLVSSLFYVFIYPFFSEKAIAFYRKKQVAIANTVKTLEGERLLTPKESTARTRKHEAERRTWEESEIALNAEITALRDALEAAEKQAIAAPQIDIEPAVSSSHPDPVPHPIALDAQDSTPEFVTGVLGVLKPEAIKLLIGISKNSGGVFPGVWADDAGRNFTLVEFDLEKLKELGLTEKQRAGNWLLTPKGRQVVVHFLSNHPQ